MTELDEVADAIWDKWDNYIRRYPVEGPSRAVSITMKEETQTIKDTVEHKLRLKLLLVGELRSPNA